MNEITPQVLQLIEKDKERLAKADEPIGILGGIKEALNPQRILDNPIGTASVMALPGGTLINAALMALQGSDAKTPIERAGSAVGAELLSAPGAAAGLIGIGEMGVRTATGTDINKAAFSDLGIAKMDALENPGIPDEIKARIPFGMEDLNWGLRNLNANVEWARDVAEVERLEDGTMPLTDEIVGVIGSTFVGLPKAVVTRAASHIARTAGTNAAARFALGIAQSRLGHAALRTAEVVTPGTFPLSAGNIAANAAFSAAITDVSRTLAGEESITQMTARALGSEMLTPAQEIAAQHQVQLTELGKKHLSSMAKDQPLDDMDRTPWDKYLMLGVGGMAGVYVLSALAGRPARTPFSAGESANDVTPWNPNLSDNADPLDQLFGNQTGIQLQTRLQSSSAPAAQAAVLGGMKHEDIEAILGAQTRAGGEQQVRNAIMFGKFSDGTNTVPLAQLEKMYSQFDNGSTFTALDPGGRVDSQRALANAYLYALDARQYRNVARAELATSIGTGQAKLSAMVPGTKQWDKQADKVHELTTIYNNDIRMSLTEWDDATIGKIIAQAETDPAITKFRDGIHKIMEDTLTYRINRGELSKNAAKSWKNRWGSDLIPLHEADTGTAGRVSGGGLWGTTAHLSAKRVGKAIFDQPRDPGTVTHLDSARPTDAATIKKRQDNRKNAVNNPPDVVTAIHRMLGHTVRYVEANDARKVIIDQMMSSPDTQKTIRMVASKTRSQIQKGLYPKDTHLLPIHRGGKVEFYEMGDDLLRQSMNFSPQATLGIMNSSRRLWQSFTTGKFAPWFAPKGLMFDVFSAAVTKNAGNHLGFIDGLLGVATNSRMHLPGDPTALLDALLNGSGRQIVADVFLRDFGEWFANHLGQSNTMFASLMNGISQVFGAKDIKAVGELMLNRYMRTTVGVLRNEGAFGDAATWFKNPSDTIYDDVDFGFSLAGRAYTSMLEGIHNGAKMAMFSRGMSHLRRKYNGNVPKHDIRKLAQEVRALSGDMSKQGSSRILSGVASGLPYANVTIQSMSRMGAAFRYNPTRAITGAFMGVGAPALAGLSALATAGPEALDWYYNKLAGWQRAGHIVLPSPDAILRYFDGTVGQYEFDPNDWVLVPIAPELAPIKEMFMAGIEALFGYREGAAVSDSAARDLQEGIGSVFNIIMPPTANAAFEGSGFRVDFKNLWTEGRSPIIEKPSLRTAAFDDTTSINSEIHKNTADAVVALFGTAMRVQMEMFMSADAVADDGGDWVDQMYSAMGEGQHQITKRVPVANTMIWEQSQQYSSTPLTEAYYEIMNDLSPVFKQFQVEMFGMVGNSKVNTRITPLSETPDKITKDVDGIPAPMIKSLVAASEQLFSDPVLTQLTDRMSALVREKEQVQSKRTGDPRERLDKMNQIENDRQQLATVVHDAYVQKWLDMMEQQFGRPVTPREFTSLVRRSVYGE